MCSGKVSHILKLGSRESFQLTEGKGKLRERPREKSRMKLHFQASVTRKTIMAITEIIHKYEEV